MKPKVKKFNSKVIHSGHGADKETGAVMPPIHLSSTFKQTSPGDFKYEYAIIYTTYCDSQNWNFVYTKCTL